MDAQDRDPWDLVAVPVYHLMVTLRTAEAWVRLNWNKRIPKPSVGTETVDG